MKFLFITRSMLFFKLTMLIGGLPAGYAQQAILAEWVDRNPANDPAKIALGYPPPQPVDTPLPFDGFRSYAGLHMRHQDLSLTTPWVHPEAIGTTREGRTIWAYRLGDADQQTRFGFAEPATLTNGGIHAREWQSPETVTGIMELMASDASDDHLLDYLRDNVNMIVIPSLNIDGLLQSQRYPTLNYLGVDDRYPDQWPRDGRMRRKNMLGADALLETQDDLLAGVDLNRNNEPFWASSLDRSSDFPDSLIYHGEAPASEPEIQALDAAAQLGPASQLRLYTDVHSFSQVHFWSRNENLRLAAQTEEVLRVFSDHHEAFPAQKRYPWSPASNLPTQSGIGTTDEYFTHRYEVPSWTLEIEPSNGEEYHSPLPGCGADYGGEANNCHDGFILPESEIRRVREEIAQSFSATYYRQAGPPTLRSLRLLDAASNSVLFEADWVMNGEESRTLERNPIAPLELGKPYRLWMAFDKPMRWRRDGEVLPFPGQSLSTLQINTSLRAGDDTLLIKVTGSGWLDSGFEAPGGYLNYRDDAYFMDFVIEEEPENLELLAIHDTVLIEVETGDMVGLALDADPSSAVVWTGGAWSGYESSAGIAGDEGGPDRSIELDITTQHKEPPFVLEPGITGAWFEPARDGEGFIIEILRDNVVVMYWFTYDADGEQDWYLGVGELRGNRAVFPEVLRVSGGVFGEAFDPELIEEQALGSATFTWTDCDNGIMNWTIGNRSGRQFLSRLTQVMGLDCGLQLGRPIQETAILSGAWFDPTHDGEGYVVEVLPDGRPLAYWFSFGPDGTRRWFFALGEHTNGVFRFDDLLTTRGGRFGDAFDPDDVAELPWGSLELDLDCDGGTARYESSEPGFGQGQLTLVKLTELDGLACPD